MLLQITTTHQPATDLGYLLHKNPARVQSFPMSFGQVHVFYPEASEERCTAALLLDVDPIGLVRRSGRGGEGFALEQYVNDRPYVASSFLSVAIAQVYGSALAGRSNERAGLVDAKIPLEATLSVVPCRGGETFLRRLFEPLGYEVVAESHPLDEAFPDWGHGSYFDLRLRCEGRLRDLLAHLYVLVPVLDDDKHYWVGDEEVEKLLRHGAGWLAAHPSREAITQRYLRRQRSLVDKALLQLVAEESADPDESLRTAASEEAAIEEPLRLHDQRLNAVLAVLRGSGAKRVIDLGCGEGRLLKLLLDDPTFEAILGFDVSHRALEYARDRLHLDRLPPRQRDRLTLIQGSVVYRDQRLNGYDAAAIVEVVEHLDPPRLAAFERVVFADARPTMVVLTTPNADYNRRFPNLSTGRFRHRDHRFEWSRAEFAAWAGRVGESFGYAARFLPVGPVDPELGPPTQLAVFTRHGGAA